MTSELRAERRKEVSKAKSDSRWRKSFLRRKEPVFEGLKEPLFEEERAERQPRIARTSESDGEGGGRETPDALKW